MDATQIQAALDDVHDQALIYHAFTPYMRDYELIVHATADPRSGIAPQYLRYLFTFCVEATTRTALDPETWRRSQDDRLIDHESGVDLDGFVWGVNWQLLYPAFDLVPNSSRARSWSRSLGTDFHELRVASNAHEMSLVFADLVVEEVDDGYAPFVVEAE